MQLKSLRAYCVNNAPHFLNSRQLVVGHSHGGNVALLALKYLDASTEAPFVSTLATPFIEAYPGGFERFSNMDVARCSVLFFCRCLGTKQRNFQAIAV